MWSARDESVCGQPHGSHGQARSERPIVVWRDGNPPVNYVDLARDTKAKTIDLVMQRGNIMNSAVVACTQFVVFNWYLPTTWSLVTTSL